jgi:ubiquinone/menaquinone biosynthesis C-methylase UbiE
LTLTPAEAWRAHKPASFVLLEAAEGDQVLDVGCGTGEDVREIARRHPGVAVVGVDADAERVAEAERLTLGVPRPVEFRVADAVRLPFEPGTFDAVRADRVFHHLEDPAAGLAEMVRVTRAGGRVVVSDVEYESLVVGGADHRVTRRVAEWWCDHHVPQGRIGRQLPGRFRDAGLEAVEVHPVVLLVTTYDEDVLHLAERATQAAAAGALPQDEADHWVAALREADRAERFLCALTVLTVRGRRR